MKTSQVALLGALLCSSAFSAKPPVDLQTCRETGADFQECLRAAVQDALPKLKEGKPELNFLPLDPLNIPSVTIGEGKGTVNVVQKYKNFNVGGLSTARVLKSQARLTPTSWSADFDMFLPEVTLKADYDANGRILLLPIVGQGKCTITLTNLKVDLKIVASAHEKKGGRYLKLDEFRLDWTPEKVSYDFENLFNGDKRLGDEMNRVLNDNWLEVFADVKPGYVAVVEAALKDYTSRIFAKVPFGDLFPQEIPN